MILVTPTKMSGPQNKEQLRIYFSASAYLFLWFPLAHSSQLHFLRLDFYIIFLFNVYFLKPTQHKRSWKIYHTESAKANYVVCLLSTQPEELEQAVQSWLVHSRLLKHWFFHVWYPSKWTWMTWFTFKLYSISLNYLFSPGHSHVHSKTERIWTNKSCFTRRAFPKLTFESFR